MKTKNLIFTVLAFTVMGTITVFAENVKETRKVGSFSKLEAVAGINIYFTQSDTYKVEVETREAIIGTIITEVKGNTLFISRPKNETNHKKVEMVEVYIAAPHLDEVLLVAGSNFNSDKMKVKESFKVEMSSGSKIIIGDLAVNDRISINASSGASCKIEKLQAKDCNIDVSSGSSANLNADISGRINADSSSGATINLAGKVNHINISSSSGGKVDVTNLTYETIDSNKSDVGKIHK